MLRDIVFDRLDQFISEMKSLGISRIAFAETNEKRALPAGPDVLQVSDFIRLELLAYRESTIYKCVMSDVDLNLIHDMLEREGFEITRRSRNIT